MPNNEKGALEDRLTCPACGQPLAVTRLAARDGVCSCAGCEAVFPLIDDIYVLLVEQDAFPEREERFAHDRAAELERAGFSARFAARLQRLKGYPEKTWEKEDVAFWEKRYENPSSVLSRRHHPASNGDYPGYRFHRREKLFLRALKTRPLADLWLLEVGSGEGAIIRDCMSPRDHHYQYVPTDYSFNALKALGREYQGLSNVHLVQCTGSRLPFRDGTFDVIFLLGILHHMPKKEEELPGIFRKLKPGGTLDAYEGFQRKSRLSAQLAKLARPWIEPEHSEHEERIDRDRFLELARQLGRLDLYKEEHTVVLTTLVKLLGDRPESSVLLTKLLFLADDAVIATLGRLFGLFTGGSFYASVVSPERAAPR